MGQSMTTSSGGSLIKMRSSLKNFIVTDDDDADETDWAGRGGAGREGAYGGGGAGLDVERR